jgi:hypothetical protein
MLRSDWCNVAGDDTLEEAKVVETAAAACLPNADQMENTSVDISDTYPNRRDTTPRNVSQAGNRIRQPYDSIRTP